MTTTATLTPTATDQLRQKAGDVTDSLVDMAGIAKGIASERLNGIKEGATSGWRAGVACAGKARDGAIAYVKDHPGRSLLACLGIGALAGFLVSRRR